MKKTNIIYWIFTGLLAVGMGLGAIPDVISSPDAVAIVSTHLHYPLYFTPYIGVAKILGVIAILLPGFPRLKEWAYAGLFFDLASVVVSSVAVGDSLTSLWPMSLFFIVFFGSYIYYHKRRKEAAMHTA